jgi:hypothetical protein
MMTEYKLYLKKSFMGAIHFFSQAGTEMGGVPFITTIFDS